MKRVCASFAVLTVAVIATLAPVAAASTKAEAGEVANRYAEAHMIVGDVEHCVETGKHRVGVAEFYCYGYARQWKVNVGPLGEVTYAGLSE